MTTAVVYIHSEESEETDEEIRMTLTEATALRDLLTRLIATAEAD